MSRSRSGFSLIELIITLALLSIVMTGVMSVVLNMQKGYVRQREVARSEDALRVAETTLANIFRMAGANPMSLGGVDAPIFDANPRSSSAYDNVRIAADFNPADGNMDSPLEDVEVWTQSDTLYVRWQADEAPAPVAYPVRSMLFVYDSSGTALTNATDIARSANRVKVTLTAPRYSNAGALARREIWVHLRNRS
jgi:prepilin-type N-terminal cleavage/methylation domain-containing protein